jgi:hypothetical protein
MSDRVKFEIVCLNVLPGDALPGWACSISPINFRWQRDPGMFHAKVR